MENRNLIMDEYQMTMAYSYFKEGKHKEITSYYNYFFRKIPGEGGYVIFNGLDKVIDYVKNFKFTDSDIKFLRRQGIYDEEFLSYLKTVKFTGNIYAVPDGTVVFPNEPIITVRANAIEAQLLETKLLLLVNYPSLVTTKANRMVNAAHGRGILEFGTRRAQLESAAVEGAKYAYIGGCIGTSCLETGKEYGIPTAGTMAHSYIEQFDSEYDAFMAYARTFKDKSVFLVDTYNTLESGIPNAIKVAQNYLIPNGYRLKGIRLDSGDLLELSIVAREMLDRAGLNDCKIIASNSLDENAILSLVYGGARIDIFGVGERLITSASNPVLGGVYKLVAIEKNHKMIPKIKLSDTSEKIIDPGFKRVYRFYQKQSDYAIEDYIALYDEDISKKRRSMSDCYVKELSVPIFKNGKLVYKEPTIEKRRQY